MTKVFSDFINFFPLMGLALKVYLNERPFEPRDGIALWDLFMFLHLD